MMPDFSNREGTAAARYHFRGDEIAENAGSSRALQKARRVQEDGAPIERWKVTTQ